MIPVITLSLMIALAATMVILWPLLEIKSVAERPKDFFREFDRLVFEKERYLNNLKDLELDRSMKKIAEKDYEDLRSQLLSEASVIYRELEKIEKEYPILLQMEKDVQKLEKELS
ncbi:MAG: hypothetical protein JWQ35_1105 [Bacteriovoracaceae bacterium]|nr:hypothetical protein [Bacteriovoracaceae bacterium]